MTRNETNIDVVLAQNGIRKDTDLAKRLKISPQTLYSRLSGEITIKTLEEIANEFNVSVKELIKD